MKKRVIAFLLAAMMSGSILAGCGSANADFSGEPKANAEQSSERGEGDARRAEQKKSTNESNIADNSSNVVKGEFFDSAMGIQNNLSGATASADFCESEVWLCPVDPYYEEIPFNTEEYRAEEENPFRQVAMSPLSTFSADVDTASYSNVRRMIRSGCNPKDIPSGAVRTEEMLNYFSYGYKGPRKNEPFGVTASISRCPWNEEAELLVLGLQTESIDFSDAPDSNLVFLIDVSGSMYDDNKLPLLKKAFEMLAENLGEKDRVSIVTYASSNEVVLEGVPGSDQHTIKEALEGLEAGGCTNGGEGIISAYKLAEKYFIKDGNNRVILATDGDLNVGITSESGLKTLIEEKRENGVFLSVLGFGMGNYSDTRMETLADYGNGNYAYIDSLSEAKKVLVEEMGATFVTVAKDVKLQIEFNPAVVSEYRLIGYENRTMAAEDFADDTKDAGEIGAGHSVTVVYEIVTCKDGEQSDSGLKYQHTTLSDLAKDSDEWMTLSVRYKEPSENTSKLLEYPIGAANYTENPTDDFLFAAAVAEFSMVLKDSAYVKDGSYRHVLKILNGIELGDEYKEEFYNLVDAARLQAEW